MSADLTDSDLSMVVYFKRHKGDFARWCNWDAKKKEVFAKFPHLYQAIQAEYAASVLMEAALAEIEDSVDDQP